MQVVELQKNTKLVISERLQPIVQPDSCLVKIKYCGVCSTDIYRAFGNGAYNYPLIMGHEMSGIIEDVGPEVKNFYIGDKVSIFPLLPCFKCMECKKNNYALCETYSYFGSRCDGGYSEYLLVKPWNLMQVSNEVKLEDSCFMEPTAVVMHALRIASVMKKKKKSVC